jgi:hypothetical protein
LARGLTVPPPPRVDLPKLVDESDVIAVAHFAGEWTASREGYSVDLDLTRVIKGKAAPGIHGVSSKSDPLFRFTKREFIAFLGKDLRWRFAALPTGNDNGVTGGVLRVESVDVYSDIRPNWLTLSQVETYVKARTLVYTIRGPLYFPSRDRSAWRRSPLEIAVRYDAVKGQGEVQSLPGLTDFAAIPQVQLSRGGAGEVDVIYPREGMTRDRHLRIRGMVESFDRATGIMRARFHLGSRLAVGQFSDSSEIRYSLTVKLDCIPRDGAARRRTLAVQLGEESNRPGELTGWGEAPLPLERFEDDPKDAARQTVRATAKLESGQELALWFDCGRIGKEPEAADMAPKEKVLCCLLAGDLKGQVLLHDDKGEREVMTFTGSLEEIRYLRPEPPAWRKPAAEPTEPASVPPGTEAAPAPDHWAWLVSGGWHSTLSWAAFVVAFCSAAAAIVLRIWRRWRPISSA